MIKKLMCGNYNMCIYIEHEFESFSRYIILNYIQIFIISKCVFSSNKLL